jgi:hemin uptake protein HemP
MSIVRDRGEEPDGWRVQTSCRPDDSAFAKISSEALLSNRKALIIEHEGCEYTLRVTRQNKLILTK